MDKIKSYLKKQSIRKSFFSIIFLVAAIVILLSICTVSICNGIRDKILLSNAFVIQPVEINQNQNGSYEIKENPVNVNNNGDYSKKEIIACRILEILIIVIPIFFSFLGIWCAWRLFYYIKLKEPLKLLEEGIDHISENNLDFSMTHQEEDELGKLCNAFEKMRAELLKNNIMMWDLIDERKKINASMSHDLRTPITIIKGYTEYLENNLEKRIISNETMLEIIKYIRQAAERLEYYTNSVQDIQTLEEIDLKYEKVNLLNLNYEIKSALEIVSKEYNKKINVVSYLPDISIKISRIAVFRILENIISNACRYCNNLITVDLLLSGEYFTIVVIDDGNGFSSQDLEHAINPFYKDKKYNNHFGLGLTICKILSEKHNGSIVLSNDPAGGAKVVVKIKSCQ